jgi:hypothetical protein
MHVIVIFVILYDDHANCLEDLKLFDCDKSKR